MTVLFDANLLIAAFIRNDINHGTAIKALQTTQKQQKIVVAPVLVEVFYLVGKHLGYMAATQTDKLIREQFKIEPLGTTDMERMEAIMRQYKSARLDYTDTAIMAVSERLNITQVYTFDHRDFDIFRPIHYPTLTILP